MVAIAVFIAGVEPPGGTERLIQDLERERRASLWLSENMTDLIEEYGIQFVAIRDQEIVGHSSRFSELLEELEAADIDPRSVKIELLTEDVPPRIA